MVGPASYALVANYSSLDWREFYRLVTRTVPVPDESIALSTSHWKCDVYLSTPIRQIGGRYRGPDARLKQVVMKTRSGGDTGIRPRMARMQTVSISISAISPKWTCVLNSHQSGTGLQPDA
jgi:hypothetical protein